VDNPQQATFTPPAADPYRERGVQVRIQDRPKLGHRPRGIAQEVLMIKEITKSTVQKRAAVTAGPSTPQAKPGASKGLIPVSLEQRQTMICEAAYYIAEHRGFEPGHDVDDWLAAEREIDAVLTSSSAQGTGLRLQR
jgi:hypothetical protein